MRSTNSRVPACVPGRVPERVAFAIVGVCVIAVAGCAPADDGRPPEVQAYGIVAAPPLPTSAPQVDFDRSDEIADVDGSVVVALDADEVVFSKGPGWVSDAVPVGDDLELRAVSADGHRAALFDGTDSRTSRIVVVDRSTPEPEVTTFHLPGLVEPEAFSTDGTTLFVIDHQVASVDGAYRVRPLDLATGTLETILGPTKQPFEDDMNGVGRRQVWSPDGTRLYTLYIRQTHHHHDDGTDHAHGEAGTDGFVHVLDLDEEWAFCLDLPKQFGAGDLATTALAVSPDGSTIAVADATAGALAFASTDDLVVTGTAVLPPLRIDGELHIGMAGDALIVASGRQAQWFDAATSAPLGDGPIPIAAPVEAITSGGPDSVLAWTADIAAGPLQLPAPPPIP